MMFGGRSEDYIALVLVMKLDNNLNCVINLVMWMYPATKQISMIDFVMMRRDRLH